MVTLDIRRALVAALTLGFAVALTAKEPSEYRVGDTVEADLVTPAELRVADPQAVEILAAEAAKEVPAIFRFHPDAALEVEENLRAELATVRTNFLEAMGAVYKVPKLNPAWLNSRRYQTLYFSFTNQHRDFPLLTELIPLWALGKTDGDVLITLSAPLRDAMNGRIRPDAKAGEFATGPRLRFVTNSDPAAPLLAADVEQPG
ncbi:MAG: hypothetical protein EXS35_00845 [Pedosphaera sp.]|nr:hypothetical protein [Pedosphaera sp.]